MIAVFYALPVVQLVITYQKVCLVTHFLFSRAFTLAILPAWKAGHVIMKVLHREIADKLSAVQIHWQTGTGKLAIKMSQSTSAVTTLKDEFLYFSFEIGCSFMRVASDKLFC